MNGCLSPGILQSASSGWGHWLLAAAGSLLDSLNFHWPSGHPGSLGQLSRALYSHWLPCEPFSSSFSGIFLGEMG